MIFSLEYCSTNAIENAPFKIDRPEGSYRYIFFHFVTAVTMVLNDEVININPGTCILYSPGKKQYFYTEKSRLNHDYIDFLLYDKDFFKKINFPVNKPFNIRNSELINNLIQEIADEKMMENLGYQYNIEAKMINFFVTLSRKYHHKKTYSYDKYMNEVKEDFEKMRLDMFQKPDGLKIADIAKKQGFSLTRFSVLYKNFFGCTPSEDLNKARIERVEDLLKNGYSTREIIKIIGFSSEEYFYRWFKKNFYITKEDYVKVIIGTEKK
jgi:AraC-like DNA-binding protein